MNRYTYQYPSSSVLDFGIVLAGKTGSGKSATGNTIVGRDAFRASRSGISETSESSYATSKYKDRRITVVDTPGVHDNVRSASVIKREIARVAFLLQEGVHCFVICMNASEVRVTDETKQFLAQVEVIGHSDFFNYCMLVYTKPESELCDISLNEYLETQMENAEMKKFLEKIGENVLAVNNKAEDPREVTRNKDAIMAMVEKVSKDNLIKNRPVAFTNNTFKTAKELREKIVSAADIENCHPSLVNAVIEGVIWFSNWGTVAEDEFVVKVFSILRNSEQCVIEDTDLVFRNDDERTTLSVGLCKQHIRIIYKAVQSNISVFYKMLALIRSNKKKYGATAATAVTGTGVAVGLSGVAAVGAVLGLPAVIAYHIGDKVYKL